MKYYYPHSLETLEREIKSRSSNARPDEHAIDTDMPSYLLWMIEKIRTFDITSQKDALKAARWLGWMWGVVEYDLKLWNNARTREITRVDVRNGHDMAVKKEGEYHG